MSSIDHVSNQLRADAMSMIHRKLSGQNRLDALKWVKHRAVKASQVEAFIARIETLPDREKPFPERLNTDVERNRRYRARQKAKKEEG